MWWFLCFFPCAPLGDVDSKWHAFNFCHNIGAHAVHMHTIHLSFSIALFSRAIFSRISVQPHLKPFRDSLLLFMKHHLSSSPSSPSSLPRTSQILQDRLELVELIMRTQQPIIWVWQTYHKAYCVVFLVVELFLWCHTFPTRPDYPLVFINIWKIPHSHFNDRTLCLPIHWPKCHYYANFFFSESIFFGFHRKAYCGCGYLCLWKENFSAKTTNPQYIANWGT